MAIIVIYGPPATGKTSNAARFRQHYCCSRILDQSGDERDLRRTDIRDGDLILAIDTTHLQKIIPGARFISIIQARRTCNLGPVPGRG